MLAKQALDEWRQIIQGSGTVVERRSLAGELSLSCARPAADGWPLICSWVPGKPSAVGQPTRPTRSAFHPFGVYKMSSELESDVCCSLQVAPSGESYEGKRRPGRKQWQTTAGYMAWFTSRHLRADCGLTACTPGSAPGPTLGNEYGKTLPFSGIFKVWWGC